MGWLPFVMMCCAQSECCALGHLYLHKRVHALSDRLLLWHGKYVGLACSWNWKGQALWL